MTAYPELDKRQQRGKAFLGTEYAVMAGAMSWVSERRLVSAISNAGGFGVIACSAMSPERLREEIRATQALARKPFGVNLIVMHPDMDALIRVCIEENVAHVVLAGGVPSKTHLETLKNAGVHIVTFAPSLSIAERLIRLGSGAIVIEGHEAGGHVGPVATSVLCQEILPFIAKEVPVFVAGGIATGEAVAAYLRMGASGVQIGTRFACATESVAHPRFKAALMKANSRDAAVSVQLDPEFPVIPVRAVKNKATEEFMQAQREAIAAYKEGRMSKKEAGLAIEHFWAGSLRRAVVEGDVEHGSLMAGQSVGLVTKEEPVADILAEIAREAEAALGR